MLDDDKAWVKKQLLRLETPKMRQEVLKKYNDAFWSAHDKEQLSHKKDGSARFSANNRLRVFINKVTGQGK